MGIMRIQGYDEKKTLKRGAWSAEEDQKLVAYITRYGIWNWSEMPRFAGLSRCGKSCRLRWMNYLKPDINHENFTHEEDETILKLHHVLGNRWSRIASRMPGRTDNDIKNHWHSRLKKRLNNKNNYGVQETQTSFIVAPPGASDLEGCNNKVMSTPTSPQLRTDNNVSVSVPDSAVVDTEDINIFTQKYQNFWEQSFTEEEGLCFMDGIGDSTFTDPGFMESTSLTELEDNISHSTFFGDELWS